MTSFCLVIFIMKFLLVTRTRDGRELLNCEIDHNIIIEQSAE